MRVTQTDSLLELCKHIPDVSSAGKTDHDVKFLQLHIDWVVVLHKKNLDVFPQNFRAGVRR